VSTDPATDPYSRILSVSFHRIPLRYIYIITEPFLLLDQFKYISPISFKFCDNYKL